MTSGRRFVYVAALLASVACGSNGSTAPSPTPTPTPTSFQATGRAVDALTQAGYPGITISGDGLQTSSSDATGAFTIGAATAASDPRSVVFTGSAIVERRTNVRVPGPAMSVSLISSTFDLNAFNQMFRVPLLLRWTTAPPLLIETRALQFTSIGAPDQVALADQMSDAEVAGLADDLTWALPQLTGGTFGGFASVSRQTSNEGTTVHILNPGVITVSRVVGLNATAGFWGYSRWQFLSDGTVTGGRPACLLGFGRGGMSAGLDDVCSVDLDPGRGRRSITAVCSALREKRSRPGSIPGRVSCCGGENVRTAR